MINLVEVHRPSAALDVADTCARKPEPSREFALEEVCVCTGSCHSAAETNVNPAAEVGKLAVSFARHGVTLICV